MTHVENPDVDASIQEERALAAPSPEERLQMSRQALQRWIERTYHMPEAAKSANRDAAEASEPGWFSVLADSLTDVPAATIAVRWVKRWWRHHPWRATVDVLSTAGRELAKPVASKHPWMLLGGAILAGGLLIRLKPWKWVSGGALLAGLLPHVSLTSILHTALSTLTRSRHDASPSAAGGDEDVVGYETDQPHQEQMAA